MDWERCEKGIHGAPCRGGVLKGLAFGYEWKGWARPAACDRSREQGKERSVLKMEGEASLIWIVGASGAGLFAAWRLAAAGRRVLVCERRAKPCWAPRTLIVTDQLRWIWPSFPDAFLRHRIIAFELWAGSTRIRIPLARPDWVVERAELLSGLAQLATHAGAEIRWGWRFAGRRDGTLTFVGADGSIREERPSVVVAADGAGGRLGRAFGLPSFPRLLLLQARVPLPRWAHPDQAIVWFDPEALPYFYWLIPESPRFGVLGLIAEPGRPIRSLLDRFLDSLGLEPLTYQGGVAAAYQPGFPFGVRREGIWLLRVGDAGGHVKVTTVGGTVTGLWGADAAVDILLGRGGRAARALEAELLAHWVVRRILHRFSVEDYERLFRALNQRSLRWLAATPRDRLASGAWRLLLAQPRLLLWTLRALLR
jgi:flavin-dependent dehydrogenase